MNPRFLLALLLLAPASAPAQSPEPPPSAEAIMAKVGANQDGAEKARASYVYTQHARVVSLKNRKILCEEVTESRVTPTENGSQQRLLTLNGRRLLKGKYVSYTELPRLEQQGMGKGEAASDDVNIGLDDDTDRDLVENMRKHLVNDTSKDGIEAGLFPLTTRIQSEYTFRLLGRERMNGREVFHLEFRPRDKSEFAWKGDAYIDTVAYQPVVVRTTLSRKVPFAVRALLGTNVPGLGFSVAYARQPDGVWFPLSFGTEFKIHVLFFFRREITIAAENRDFEKTHVKARILGDVTVETSPPRP